MHPITRLIAGGLLVCACAPAPSIERAGDHGSFGKADSFASPTEHGTLVFGDTAEAEFTDGSRFHVWEFALSGAATVDLLTEPTDWSNPSDLDTVIYLYANQESGWGSYIVMNDDNSEEADAVPWSEIITDLGAGRYRALVKSKGDDDRGKFAFRVSCEAEDEGACELGAPELISVAVDLEWTCGENVERDPLAEGVSFDEDNGTYRVSSTAQLGPETECRKPVNERAPTAVCRWRAPRSDCWDTVLSLQTAGDVTTLHWRSFAGDNDASGTGELPLGSLPTDGQWSTRVNPDDAGGSWGGTTVGLRRSS